MGFLKKLFGKKKTDEKSKNKILLELEKENAEKDKKITEIQRARDLYKDGQLEKSYDAFKVYIEKNGLNLFSNTIEKDYFNLLYKMEKYDELWSKTNDYMTKEIEDTNMLFSRSITAYSFQIKVLKKEKKYKRALLIKIYELITRNISQNNKSLSNSDVQKKLRVLLNKTDLNDHLEEIQDIISKYSKKKSLDAIKIKDEYYKIANK